MNSLVRSKDWKGKLISYSDALVIIDNLPECEFNDIVASGNLIIKEFKYSKTTQFNITETSDGVSLQETKEIFIQRAKRELGSSASNFLINYKNEIDALREILEQSQQHFKKIDDSFPYDYNFLLSHGYADGYTYQDDIRAAKIADVKKQFESTNYNLGKNIFYCCYVDGFPIQAGVRAAKLVLSETGNVRRIEFTPASPWYSDYIKK